MTNSTRRNARSLAETAFLLREFLAPITTRFRPHFTVDTRSLAALRIALGTIVVVDLWHRARSLEMFYTEGGVYPLSIHKAAYGQHGVFSIYSITDALWFQSALFVIAGLFALAFVAGYRTRLVGAISLVLLVSLHIRNPAVLNGGDRLLRVLLFVALLTPLGERWSIDSLRRGSARRSVVSVGTAALLAQPLVVFTVNAVEKRRGEHWYTGEALELALYDGTMATPLGAALLEFPTLLTWLTYGWIALLAGAIPLLLITTGRARALAATAYVLAFVGMGLTLSVGLFPLVLAASVVPFFTEPFWNWSVRRVPGRISERISAMTAPRVLESERVERRMYNRLKTRGYVPPVARIASFRRVTWTIVATVVLLWILVFAAVDATGSEPPAPLDSDHLDQQDWGLYAPDPAPSTHWHVVEAELEDGSTVDARRGGPVRYDRPPNADTAYESFRHRSFLQTVSASENRNGPITDHYADWACERASEISDADAERVTVYRRHQPKPVDGGSHPPETAVIAERSCR